MQVRCFILLLIAVPTFFFACNKSEIEDTGIEDFGYDYFPLEVGRSWEYEVDSIIYDPVVGGTAVDSFRTFIRESVVDTLLDNTGEVLYRVERYYRRSDTLAWQIEKCLPSPGMSSAPPAPRTIFGLPSWLSRRGPANFGMGMLFLMIPGMFLSPVKVFGCSRDGSTAFWRQDNPQPSEALNWMTW